MVAEALVEGLNAEQFEQQCTVLFGTGAGAGSDGTGANGADGVGSGNGSAATLADRPTPLRHEPHRFFPDLYAFAKQAIARVPEAEGYRVDDQACMLRLTPPADLRRRLRRQLPAEVLRETNE